MVTVQAGTWGIFPVFWAEDKVGFGGVGVPQSAGKCVCIMASDTFGVLIISAKIPFDAFNIIRGDVHGRE